MSEIPDRIKEKLHKIAREKETDFDDIVEQYKEVYSMVEQYYNLASQEDIAHSALRRLIGSTMSIDEMTGVLMPLPT